jgi:hypothetical protein
LSGRQSRKDRHESDSALWTARCALRRCSRTENRATDRRDHPPGGKLHLRLRPHGVQLDGEFLFFTQVGMLGGPAPVRRFLPQLIDLVLQRKIQPGKVFDLELPLAEVAEGYKAMDERRAIKSLLRV